MHEAPWMMVLAHSPSTAIATSSRNARIVMMENKSEIASIDQRFNAAPILVNRAVRRTSVVINE